VTTHFTARVRLTNQTSKVDAGSRLQSPTGNVIDASEIYRLYFHGPAYRVIEKAWWDGNQIIGRMARNLPDNHHPSELPTIMTPRLIELCFQTAGVWEMGIQGRMGLPQHIECVSSWVPKESGELDGQLYAIVTPDERRGTFDADVIDSQGRRLVSLRGYGTVAIPSAIESDPIKALRAAMSLEAVAV